MPCGCNAGSRLAGLLPALLLLQCKLYATRHGVLCSHAALDKAEWSPGLTCVEDSCSYEVPLLEGGIAFLPDAAGLPKASLIHETLTSGTLQSA
jgi:hypothetical protein